MVKIARLEEQGHAGEHSIICFGYTVAEAFLFPQAPGFTP
jgi:hypothetical protein